jgi:hypothetical protein
VLDEFFTNILYYHNGMNKLKPCICKTAVKLPYALQAATYHCVVWITRYDRDDNTCCNNVPGFCSNWQANRRMWFQSSAPPPLLPPVFRSRRSHQLCAREHLGAFRGFLVRPFEFQLFIICVVRTITDRPERGSNSATSSGKHADVMGILRTGTSIISLSTQSVKLRIRPRI